MSTLTNGQVRKSLASQIDRLDHLLDGLAEERQGERVARLRFPEPAPCGRGARRARR